MLFHFVRIIAISLLIVFCTFQPYFPGDHDALASTLSTMAQVGAIAGLLLVPIGVIWIVFELRRPLPQEGVPTGGRGYYFLIVSLVAASLVAAVTALAATANSGYSLGLAVLALWLYLLSRIVPQARLMRDRGNAKFNPAPLYLICIPAIVFLARLLFISRAAELARSTAIANSQSFINDIEAYREANGIYPVSLEALWKDYRPNVIGIRQYHYEPSGDAYNLFFELPAYEFGTQEIVMYNKLDEQAYASHDSHILRMRGEELRVRRGSYSTADTPVPHWKRFLLD